MASKELYIGNVDRNVKVEEIRQVFELYGTISRCEVKFGGITHTVAYGFVGFDSIEDAERAQREENGRSFHGRRLIVQFTKTKPGEKVRGGRFIGLDRMENSNSNRRDRSRSRNRDDSRDRYRRQRRSASYNRRSTSDRNRNDDRHRKRHRSRSSSDHKSTSKRHRLSSDDDKYRTSNSYKNGNSKKR